MVRRLCFLLVGLAVGLGACAGQSDTGRFATAFDAPYRLDSGDRLRIVVFDQADLSDTYSVDDSGEISMPLIGSVTARGRTARQLEDDIAAALREGYLRQPSVAVQVDTHRPFYILGEVGEPGQYSYAPDLTARRAVAIAGGFSPRAVRRHVVVTRRIDGEIAESRVPIDSPLQPGDTIRVIERWF